MSDSIEFDDLKLLPGTKLDLRSEQYKLLKGTSSFIGHLKQKSLIVSTPMSQGRPIACKAGNQVVIRLFVNHLNCACAFRAEILHVGSVPYPHLFLSIPDKMEIGEVRSSVRAMTSLPCFVTSSSPYRNEKMKSTINNLSIDGAKLNSEEFLGDPEEKIFFKAKIKVLDLEEVIEINAVIRSMTGDKNQFSYGIQFLDVDSSTKLLIYAYVMSQIKN